ADRRLTTGITGATRVPPPPGRSHCATGRAVMRAVTATPEHSRAWRASRRLPRPRRAQPSEDHADEPQRHGHDVAADPVTGAHVTVGAGAPCGAEEIADLVGAWDGDEC